jgi:hypothetical protein
MSVARSGFASVLLTAVCAAAAWAAPVDPGERVREINFAVDDNLKAGPIIPRQTATDLLADLTDLLAKTPLDKLNPIQQARVLKAQTYCRLSLGDAGQARDLARQWTKIEPDALPAWEAVHECALALGDKVESLNSYRTYLKVGRFAWVTKGKKPPDLSAMSADEVDKFLSSPEQEAARERVVDMLAKRFGSVGRDIPAVLVAGPGGKKTFEWKKNTGKALVIAVWNSGEAASSQLVLDAYRELYKLHGEGGRTAFLALNGPADITERRRETEAMAKEALPGGSHQEVLSKPGGLYQRQLNQPPFPVLVVIGADGKSRYAGGPAKVTLRQAAFALAACLREAGEDTGGGK